MLYLSREQKEALIAHSKSDFPNEACGILAGRHSGEGGGGHIVEKAYPMSNTDKSAATFFMDPKEQLKVMKEIRNLGLDMVGIYHSHPKTAAYPSAHDVKLAYYPAVSYVIISIKDKDKPSIRSFSIEGGKITEEEIRTE